MCSSLTLSNFQHPSLPLISVLSVVDPFLLPSHYQLQSLLSMLVLSLVVSLSNSPRYHNHNSTVIFLYRSNVPIFMRVGLVIHFHLLYIFCFRICCVVVGISIGVSVSVSVSVSCGEKYSTRSVTNRNIPNYHSNRYEWVSFCHNEYLPLIETRFKISYHYITHPSPQSYTQ